MVNVKFSPNQGYAKLRALLFQWELLFLWVPLHDCRKRGRRDTRTAQEPRDHLTVTAMSSDAENLDFIPVRLTGHNGLRDVFHMHVPIAPLPSVCSFHTDGVLTRANAIYYEDYSKSPTKLSLKAKETYALALAEVKEKSLKKQELSRIKCGFPSTVSSKLQLTKATKSHPLKQFQTSAGKISKQIIQPELEESSAQDLLHIAGTTLGRRYFFSKQTASELTQSMIMWGTTKPGLLWNKPLRLRVHFCSEKD